MMASPAPHWGWDRGLPWRAQRWLRGARERVARPNPAPVVVFGNQKSGTSAVAGLLARLTATSVTLDLEPEWRAPCYHQVRRGEVAFRRFVRRNGRGLSRDIVKEPNLLLLWEAYLAAFPGARKVLVVRDPRDNLRSVLDRLGLPGDRDDLPARDRRRNGKGWELYLSGEWLGLAGWSYVEVMAWRWDLGYRFWAANRADTVLIRYEDFVADKEGVLTDAANRLGLAPVAGLGGEGERAFQPAGRPGRSWRAVFGERNLARIEALCAEGMREFGYAPVSG